MTLSREQKIALKMYTLGVAVGLFGGLMIAVHYGWKPWL